MSLPRMRDAKGCLEIIKEQDPDTGITLNFIRTIIRSGSLPSIRAGKRKLVNVDMLIAHIEQLADDGKPLQLQPGIRKICE